MRNTGSIGQSANVVESVLIVVVETEEGTESRQVFI